MVSIYYALGKMGAKHMYQMQGIPSDRLIHVFFSYTLMSVVMARDFQAPESHSFYLLFISDIDSFAGSRGPGAYTWEVPCIMLNVMYPRISHVLCIYFPFLAAETKSASCLIITATSSVCVASNYCPAQAYPCGRRASLGETGHTGRGFGPLPRWRVRPRIACPSCTLIRKKFTRTIIEFLRRST